MISWCTHPAWYWPQQKTISAQFYHPQLLSTVQTLLHPCLQCLMKKLFPIYGKVSPALYFTMPWEIIQVDLFGSWNSISSLGTEETICAVSILDIATCWLELQAYNSKRSDTISHIVYRELFYRYHPPSTVIYCNDIAQQNYSCFITTRWLSIMPLTWYC